MPEDATPAQERALTAHLTDAIRLNRARRAHYVRAGGHRARSVSQALVTLERAALPVAAWFEREARPFVQSGVPVLVGDVVPMGAVPPIAPLTGDVPRPSTPPPDSATLHPKRALRALKHESLRGVAEALQELLDALAWQAFRTQRRGALARHLVESAGWAALRGVGYAQQTGGATEALSRQWIRTHLRALPLAARLDRAAHPLHRQGLGILVHDLPPIPFEDALRARSA